MVAGIPQSREFRTGQAFADKHRDRQVGVAKQLFSAMGIARDNKDKRQDWVLRGRKVLCRSILADFPAYVRK
jgi:hypothetical protein